MNYFMKDQVTAAERMNFKRVRAWKELLWKGSKNGYSTESTIGKTLQSNTKTTMKPSQTLAKHGFLVLSEEKKKECLPLFIWLLNVSMVQEVAKS